MKVGIYFRSYIAFEKKVFSNLKHTTLSKIRKNAASFQENCIMKNHAKNNNELQYNILTVKIKIKIFTYKLH